MVDMYNDIINMAKDLMENIKSSDVFKKTKESISNNTDITSLIKEIDNSQNIKPYVHLVRNANYNNVLKFDFMGKEYSLDYEKRRNIVFFIMGGLVFRYLIKMKYLKKFMFNYILLSALFCRENFDLSNYKIKTTRNKQI